MLPHHPRLVPFLAALVAGALAAAPAQAAPERWSPDFAPAPDGLGMNDVVRALAVYDNALVAGGQFTEAGGVACANIARLNGSGTAWEPLGAGSGFEVHALLADGGVLYAGGKSSEVKYWNGSAWGTLGSIPGATWVRALTKHDGQILAGVDTAPGAFRWNLGWQSMGSLGGAVRHFTETGGNLLVMGAFTTANGVPAEGVARWTGTGWEPFYTGSDTDFIGPVYGSTVFGNNLVIGGYFTTHYNEELGYRLALRQSGPWEAFPYEFPHSTSGSIQVLAEYNGHLLIGGTFMSYLSGMAKLGPAGWESVGFPPSGLISMVFAMQEFEGSLYVGGWFSQVDGKASAYIGRYTEAATTAVDDDAVPNRIRVGAAYPNPFRAQTTLAFTLEEPGPARLEVYGLNGERIRILDLGALGAGDHDVSWNGKNDRGVAVAPGVYFLRVQAGPVEQVRKVVLRP